VTRKRLTREESQAHTRERLLHAARLVFARRGYQGASVDEIAAEAGYSKGAVYSNFESKEDLLLELDRLYMRQQVEKIDTLLTQLAATEASPKEVEQAIVRWIDDLMGDGALFALSTELHLHAQRHAAFAAKCAAMKDEHRTALAALIGKMFEGLGKQRPDNAGDIAAVMIGLSMGLALIKTPAPTALMMTTMAGFLATTPDTPKRKR